MGHGSSPGTCCETTGRSLPHIWLPGHAVPNKRRTDWWQATREFLALRRHRSTWRDGIVVPIVMMGGLENHLSLPYRPSRATIDEPQVQACGRRRRSPRHLSDAAKTAALHIDVILPRHSRRTIFRCSGSQVSSGLAGARNGMERSRRACRCACPTRGYRRGPVGPSNMDPSHQVPVDGWRGRHAVLRSWNLSATPGCRSAGLVAKPGTGLPVLH